MFDFVLDVEGNLNDRQRQAEAAHRELVKRYAKAVRAVATLADEKEATPDVVNQVANLVMELGITIADFRADFLAAREATAAERCILTDEEVARRLAQAEELRPGLAEKLGFELTALQEQIGKVCGPIDASARARDTIARLRSTNPRVFTI